MRVFVLLEEMFLQKYSSKAYFIKHYIHILVIILKKNKNEYRRPSTGLLKGRKKEIVFQYHFMKSSLILLTKKRSFNFIRNLFMVIKIVLSHFCRNIFLSSFQAALKPITYANPDFFFYIYRKVFEALRTQNFVKLFSLKGLLSLSFIYSPFKLLFVNPRPHKLSIKK